MTHANPRYDPDWEAVHDRHAAGRARAAAERDRLIAAGAMATDARRRARAEFDRHHRACLATYRMRHETVQEYAAWLFGNFAVDGEDREGGIPVPVVDLAGLRTVEEADRAWARVHRIVSDSAAERRLSLPAGQPGGLRAFADPASPALSRYWREFSPRELHPTGHAGEAGTRTLVTVDGRDDGWHVCSMHDWGGAGAGVTNAIGALATAVRREACALAGRQAPAPGGGVRGWLARRRAARARAAMLAPGRFRFYQHVPPRAETGLAENFSRVVLEFRDGRYGAPRWTGYAVVPEAVRSARFDCALDAAASGARPRRALSDNRRVMTDEG